MVNNYFTEVDASEATETTEDTKTVETAGAEQSAQTSKNKRKKEKKNKNKNKREVIEQLKNRNVSKIKCPADLATNGQITSLDHITLGNHNKHSIYNLRCA